MSKPTRGRRPGPSTTREEILKAAHECLVEYGFEKSTLRKIGDRAGVSDSLLIHQFGTREKLLAEAMEVPQGLDRAFNLIRKFPKGMWGRVFVEAMDRGEIRNPAARDNFELLVRAASQSDACAKMLREWVVGQLTEEITTLGVSHPDLRARSFATLMFGMTFSNDILDIHVTDKKLHKAENQLRSHMLKAVLSEDV